MTPGDLLRFPQALTIRERITEADADLALARAAGRERRRSGARRARRDARHGRRLSARPTSMRGGRSSATCSSASRAPPTRGWTALQARLHERVRELRADALADEALIAQEIAKFVGRSDITRGGRAVPRASRPLAGALRRRRSRAAASSISCCRR